MSELALVRVGTRRLIAGSLTKSLIFGVFAGLVAVLGAELTRLCHKRKVFEFERTDPSADLVARAVKRCTGSLPWWALSASRSFRLILHPCIPRGLN